jgi:hypothetical protein
VEPLALSDNIPECNDVIDYHRHTAMSAGFLSEVMHDMHKW